MAKRAKLASRGARRRARPATRRRPGVRKVGKRPAASRAANRKAKPNRRKISKKASPGRTAARVRKAPRVKTAARSTTAAAKLPAKAPRLDRVRRLLADETVPAPPSSLNLDRHGSAVRTGRAGMAESLREHATMEPSITAGDVDASIENAYFSGDEAPGGDNPTPDQDIVDDIGRAVGVEYEDNEELKSGDKIAGRDKHRWELDPASSEDYKDRK